MNLTGTRPVLEKNRKKVVEIAKQGYWDAILGFGFSKEYETMKPHEQHNYELGRLWAISCLAIGQVPPPWKGVKFTLEENNLIQNADRANGARSIVPQGAKP